jgi:hypothetical protein
MQMVMGIAMENSTGGNHLRIEHGMPTNQAHKVATVTISPVEHGSHAEFSVWYREAVGCEWLEHSIGSAN